MTRIGILLSGRGSNFVAIAEAIQRANNEADATSPLRNAQISIVISNRADAPGIGAARDRGLPAAVIQARGRTRAEHDGEIVTCLREHQVELVCLAGYMRLLSPAFVCEYPQRILNIHPSLLPAFPGLDAQRQALTYGVAITGCTVHFVDEKLDHGVIILQRAVLVRENDEEASLAARILEQEHRAYPAALERVLSGHYEIVGRRYVLRNRGEASIPTEPDECNS
ncbi:MAG TPA: phosphoribosylglycinamide formyltransferase [Acidobacteriaceae bacterium]|nr:phosphoribosylglycinamide formyltransferase [Acidobacteriaceae bacterium]